MQLDEQSLRPTVQQLTQKISESVMFNSQCKVTLSCSFTSCMLSGEPGW